eukprot:scaffold8718_cov159-Isochrysis_galbana.AAC.9
MQRRGAGRGAATDAIAPLPPRLPPPDPAGSASGPLGAFAPCRRASGIRDPAAGVRLALPRRSSRYGRRAPAAERLPPRPARGRCHAAAEPRSEASGLCCRRYNRLSNTTSQARARPNEQDSEAGRRASEVQACELPTQKTDAVHTQEVPSKMSGCQSRSLSTHAGTYPGWRGAMVRWTGLGRAHWSPDRCLGSRSLTTAHARGQHGWKGRAGERGARLSTSE